MNNLIGPWHSRPPAGTKGNTFFPTNSNVVLVDNGKEYTPFAPLTAVHFPDLSKFSWVNQGNATIDNSNGPPYLHVPPGPGPNINAFVRPALPPPYQTTISFWPIFSNSGVSSVGICWRDSSNNKLMRFGPYFASGNGATYGDLSLGIAQYANPSTFQITCASGSGNWLMAGFAINLRLLDDGTTRSCQYGLDGIHFITLFSEPSNHFLSPDQIGLFVESFSGEAGMTVLNLSMNTL